MRATRTLQLKRERLAELRTDELREIVGAAASGATCPAADCLDNLSDQVNVCDSLLRPCITWGTCTTY